MASEINVDNGNQQADPTNNEPRVAGLDCNELSGWLRLALGTDDTAGGVFALENTTQNTYLIDLSYIDITTKSTGACTIDVGIAANGTTLNDTLFDAANLGAAVDVLNNIDDKGTNGGIGILWAPGEFITGSKASGATAGVVGNALIRYVRT